MIAIRIFTLYHTVYEGREPFVRREEMIEKLLKAVDQALPPGGTLELQEAQGGGRIEGRNRGVPLLRVEIWKVDQR